MQETSEGDKLRRRAYGSACDLSAKSHQLLADWTHGDDAALGELTPLVYEELRRLAHYHMGRERPDHTLQTTALVNEAYLRLADQTEPRWQDRAHFFAVAAKVMREEKRGETLIVESVKLRASHAPFTELKEHRYRFLQPIRVRSLPIATSQHA